MSNAADEGVPVYYREARDFLEAIWRPDDDYGNGELLIAAQSQGFSGRSSAWFNSEEIRRFAERLTTYPLGPAGSATLRSGFGADGVQPEQVHVALDAYPVGSRGQLAMRLQLATPLHPGDRQESMCCAEFEVLTSYEALGRFSSDLNHVLDGLVETARLDGDRL